MPVSTAKEIIELKSPSLVGDSRVDDFISLAELTVSENTFGDKYQYALALVVLHQITLDAQGGGSSSSSGSGVGGGIKSEKEGDLQRTYGSFSSSGETSHRKEYWNSTIFGQEYWQLMQTCLLLPRTRLVG